MTNTPSNAAARVSNAICLTPSAGSCPNLGPTPWPYLIGTGGATIQYAPDSKGTGSAELIAGLMADGTSGGTYVFGSQGTFPRCLNGSAAAPQLKAVTLQVKQSREPLADTTIMTNINKKLLANPTLKPREILVTCQKGRVTLRGTVNTASEKSEAEHIARSTAGVRQVTDQLAISAPSH